jgi:host factor-I protein
MHMTSERIPNLQEIFLNHVRKGKVPLTVFLVNGVRLQGILTWFDSYSLLLKRDAHSQLVYKHSISTILPADPVRLFEEEDKAEPAPRAALVQISPRVTMPTDVLD